MPPPYFAARYGNRQMLPRPTEAPAADSTNRSLDIWVKKLSFVRLQNIRLAYRVPSEWLHKLSIGGATVGLEARNLFVISSNYDNYMDPESMGNLYSTPVPKSITFNLSLNF